MYKAYNWEDMDLAIWELEQADMEGRRYCPEKARRAFNPAQERLAKRRKNYEMGSGSYYGKESTYVRLLHRREYRRNNNAFIKKGDYDSVYKFRSTGGWDTW